MPFTDEIDEATDVRLALLVLGLCLVGQDFRCLCLCLWVSRLRDSWIVGSGCSRSNSIWTSSALVVDRDRDRGHGFPGLDNDLSDLAEGDADGDADHDLVPPHVSLRMTCVAASEQ